jgi:hypothetical protein
MKLAELVLTRFPRVKVMRTDNGRHVGEAGRVKSATFSYDDGEVPDAIGCILVVEVDSGAMIEVSLEDVESLPQATTTSEGSVA